MNRTMRSLQILFLGSFITSLAAAENPSAPVQVAELNRVTTTRDDSGTVTVKTQPVEKSSDDEDDQDRHHHRHDAEHPDDSFVGTVLQILLNVIFNPSPDAPPAEPIDSTPRASLSQGPRNSVIEAGYAYTHIFNTLTSRFESPSFNQVHWTNALDLHSSGAEGTVLYGVADYFYIGLNAGGFGNSYSTNGQDQGGVHVQENISLSGGWGAGVLRLYPVRWLSIDGSIGVIGYSLDTRVQTNAPAFTYTGFDGTHAAALIGLGGRLQTPWRYPLKLYVGGRYWWTGGDSRPTIETGVAQFETGLAWRF